MLFILKQLKDEKLISAGDYHFAKLISEKQRDDRIEIKNLVAFLAALCSYHYQQGHTCVLLESDLLQNAFSLSRHHRHYVQELKQKLSTYPVEEWQEVLAEHPAFSLDPINKIAPLVFQYQALYFYRIWQDEYRIAQYFAQAAKKGQSNLLHPESISNIRRVLATYFPKKEEDNRAKLAVATALRQPFCLITGGPGTGKTTAVSRLLLALQALNQQSLRIRLVAPTGKAAARLEESMQKTLYYLQKKEDIHIDEALLAAIPVKAATIHRLLGVRFFEEQTQFNAQNPLPIDVLVVDEASMVDLSLMTKLLQALHPETKLILLGDKDQLASVEAGAILAELGKFSEQGYSLELASYLQECTGEKTIVSENGNPIRDSLCNLVLSRRFGDRPYIGELANLINQKQARESWELLNRYQDEGRGVEIALVDFDKINPDIERNTPKYLAYCVEWVVEQAVECYSRYLKEIQSIHQNGLSIHDHLSTIFSLFNSVRFLTALRIGELGSERLNDLIAERLRQKGLVQFSHTRDCYVGKPVMIMQNNHDIELYNGDIGLYLLEKEGDSLKGKFWFENGKSELASRLPQHEPAFVMTVHKSQGSEFDHTFLVLPTETMPILSKELVYTGVTRAKQQITIFSQRQIWESAVNKGTTRQSGLSLLLSDMLTNKKAYPQTA